MTKEINEAINNLKIAAQKHPLFKDLTEIKGQLVIGKGDMNPDFLFIGESPGFSEVKCGVPFVGKSGQLLDSWIEKFNIKKYAVINVTPLIPLGENGKIRKPTFEEIEYFRPFLFDFIECLNPKHIICLGKTAAAGLKKEFKLSTWNEKTGFIYHPAYYLRNGRNGEDDFERLIKQIEIEKKVFLTELTFQDLKRDEAINVFLNRIKAKKISENEFQYNNKKWFIDFHPFEHSDDIIIHESDINKYDNFLLVKSGASRIRIPGWCTKEQLLSTPKTDIYRNKKFYYTVLDANVKDLAIFQLEKEKKRKENFIINKQEANNLGKTEMVDANIAGLHFFAKKAGIYFKDINQVDECILGKQKIKIYTRTASMDDDILIGDSYYKKHTEIDLFICCKIKSNTLEYLGYVEKKVVDKTRIVQMIGKESDSASKSIRRIFAEQYLPMSNLIEIFEEEKEEEIIEKQNYVPLHQHSEFSTGDGFGTIKYICETLRKKGFKGAALTDHGSLGGVWEFQKEMLAKGLKPIIGYEAYLAEETGKTRKRFHATIYVKNKKGWDNLLKIHAFAIRDNFYYKPLIPIDLLLEHHSGLIVTGGCMSGIILKALADEQQAKAEELTKKFKEVFKDDFYFEIMPHTYNNNQELMQKVYSLAKQFNIKCIFTTDSHYPNQEDKKYHDALKAISMKKKYGEAGFSDDCFYLMQEKDIEKRIKEKAIWMQEHIEEFKKNTYEIYEKCNFQISPPEEMDTLPKIEGDEFLDSKDLLEEFVIFKTKALKNPNTLILSRMEKIEDEPM